MTENQKSTAIDWMTEANSLSVVGEKKNWLKPKAGTHKIIFLTNGVSFVGKDFDGNPCDKVRFDVEVNKNQYLWAMKKVKTEGSLFGQIALVARANNGALAGKMITLLVKGSGKSTQYIIQEALPLMTPAEEQEEQNESEAEPRFTPTRV